MRRIFSTQWTKIECINFHEVVHYKGIKFWCYNAGHVLGAAMFMIEIAGILHRGLFEKRRSAFDACRASRHEARYSDHWSHLWCSNASACFSRKKLFTDFVYQIFGVVEEFWFLCLLWEERKSCCWFWMNIGRPILLFKTISALAKKCMLVYQTYIHLMNKHIQQQFEISNPFVFKHISNLKSVDKFDDIRQWWWHLQVCRKMVCLVMVFWSKEWMHYSWL